MKNESVWEIIKNSIKGIFFLPCWWAQTFRTRNPNVWIFGAWQGVRYSDNSRAMFEYVLSNHPEIQAWWVTKDNAIYQKLKSQDIPVVMAYSAQGRQIQKIASIAFISWGISGDMDARYLNGCRIAYLWHGMPLKKIGKDEWDFKQTKTLWKTIKTKFREFIFPYEFLHQTAVQQGLMDTVSTSSFFTPFLQSAWQLDKQHVLEVGQPRNDKLFSSKVEKLVTEIDHRFHSPVKIMYMPTFRDNANGVFNPFALYGFNCDSFCGMLEELNMIFIYKGHFCDQNNQFSRGGRIITIGDTDYDDLYTFVKDMDILITDYSSIYFDFLLCHKPIILFPFDIEDYVAFSRPFYFYYDKLEGKKVYSWSELEKALRNKDYNLPSEETIAMFNKYIDGNSSKRLFNTLRNEQ